MKRILTFLSIILISGCRLFAQIGINADGSPPNASAGLDVKFTNKGVLPPRMTNAQMNAIPNPAIGLMIYCTDCGSTGTGAMMMFLGWKWVTMIVTCINPASPAAGTNVASPTQIVWNWNAVPGATGYKWSTNDAYGTALDMGASTSKTETGLTCNTAYTRYAWAYNACGVSPGIQMIQSTSSCPWSCGQPFSDPRDGKSYNTVLIGNQCWMAQNLNVGTRINGTVNQTNNSIIEKYCNSDLESNCTIYGGLYMWDELMQYTTIEGSQGICPAGWHIPTDGEFTTVINLLGGGSNAGGPMKEAGTAHWAAPNTGATNSSGFTAMPGGDRNTGATFTNLTFNGFYWTSTVIDANNAWMRMFYNTWEGINAYDGARMSGLSVRCLHN